jgi:parallel beta-helix repeat protein
MKGLLLPALAGLLLLLPAAPAQAARNYADCDAFITQLPAVITTPGTWCLARNLTTEMSSGTAISIEADDVTVDCKDFKVGGGGVGGRAIGIGASDRRNTEIRHCTVRRFFTGIAVAGETSGNLVEDNLLDENGWSGIIIGGTGSVVRNNRVIGTGGTTETFGNNFKAMGIYAYEGPDVTANHVAGVHAGQAGDVAGIAVYSSRSSAVSGNVVLGVEAMGAGSARGIFVDDPQRVTIDGNYVTGSGAAGSKGIQCWASISRVSTAGNTGSGWGTAVEGCPLDGQNILH